MKTPTTTTQRSERRLITDEWVLNIAPLSGTEGRIPKLEMSVRHEKEKKALTANVGYIEEEQTNRGYSMVTWETGWPLVRVLTKPITRYSEKALLAFREEALQALADAPPPFVNQLLSEGVPA